jgi:hypothetical protein
MGNWLISGSKIKLIMNKIHIEKQRGTIEALNVFITMLKTDCCLQENLKRNNTPNRIIKNGRD